MSVLVVCMSCLCLWLGKLSVLVSADYVLQVEVRSYNHRLNRRSDGQCCDPDNSGGPCNGGERCDTYFTYCLRPRFTGTDIGCPNTEPGFTANSTNVVDGATIDFTQPTVLGLPNPFNLTGISTAWEGAQLYIQVFDLDDDGTDVIERFRFDASFIILPVGTTAGGTINGNRAAITVSGTVLCAPFYTGSSCETLNHCESNAVTCSERGTCVNGFNGFTCDCNPPYIGTNCESQDFCFNTNCNERGTCNNGLDSYTCVCEPGYTGTDCDDIDDCLNVNCSGNGVCVDGVNSFSCECVSGFTGEMCSVETQEARSDDATAAIAGGVVGGLVGVVLIVVIVIVIVAVIILKNKQELSKYDVSGGGTADNVNYIDNPVYGVCETDTAQPQPNTLPTAPPPSSLPEHEFDNPLYDTSEPLPPVYESVEGRDERLMSGNYATVAEREDGLGQTSDIYDDVNT